MNDGRRSIGSSAGPSIERNVRVRVAERRQELVLSAQSAGQATITAETGNGYTATATVKVRTPAVAITVTPNAPYLTVGASRPLKVFATYDDGAIEEVTHRATWSSGNENIGVVLRNGLVDAIAAGTVTITATVDALSTDAVFTNEPAIVDPPDPVAVASPIDPTKITTVHESTRFLYEGPQRLQTGVDPGAIARERAAVLRGRVLERGGMPLSRVRITILDHPEYGQTFTRADGGYDMAVNGGGPIVAQFRKDGYVAVDRQVAPAWNGWAVADDVTMIPYDPSVTEMHLAAPGVKVHRASVVTDADGSRIATLLVPSGTTATMTLRDGSTAPLSTIHVRATEYTIGEDGQRAMPAELPTGTAYTYCVELSVDEAVDAGATNVTFSKPVALYVDNFLDFPVGESVPTGWYDRTSGVWVGTSAGRVVRILMIEGGRAYLDIDGDGHSDDSDTLLGTTVSERETLATLYHAGQTFWRVTVTHFTPWDCNWPFAPPFGSEYPGPFDPSVAGGGLLDDCSTACGSIISVENQTLGERIPIAGTSLSMVYESERSSARNENSTIEIRVSASNIPPAKKMNVSLTLAGRTFHREFDAAPNLKASFTWDGRDAYGRRLQSAVEADIVVGYQYDLVYAEGADFERNWAVLGDQPVTVLRPNRNAAATGFVMSRRETLSLDGTLAVVLPGRWDAHGVGFGGWTPSAQHTYDHSSRTLYLGDGSRRSGQGVGPVVATVAGGGGEREDGTRARDFAFGEPTSIAFGSDGSLYVADYDSIFRVGPSGTVRRIAGGGTIRPESGTSPALEASLQPQDLAVANDGSVYISETNGRVLVLRGGRLRVAAGVPAGDWEPVGEDVPAISPLSGLGIALDGSGSLLVATGSRVRQVRPDGRMHTAVGNGQTLETEEDPNGDGNPGRAAVLAYSTGVAVNATGEIFVSTFDGVNIRRVGVDGIIHTLASGPLPAMGSGGALRRPAALAVGEDGTIYAAHGNRVYAIDRDGNRVVFAGTEDYGFDGDGGPAASATFSDIRDLAIAPDGSLHICDAGNGRIRRVSLPMPGLGHGEIAIPSSDGGALYVFDADGRHQQTRDTLTGTVLQQFGYDEQGLLTSITDASDNQLTIERDGSGRATAIEAPGGQRTTLGYNSEGDLTSVTNPATETYQLSYRQMPAGGSLLSTLTTPRDHTYSFAYDDHGRLIRDADPAGGSTGLTATTNKQFRQVVSRTAEGRETTYEAETNKDRTVRRMQRDPAGLVLRSTTTPDGSTSVQGPTGTGETHRAPDARFGMLAPRLASATFRNGSHVLELSSTQDVTLADPENPLSTVESMVTSTFVNGREYVSSYDGATRTLTETSPEGRTLTAALDAQGRITSVSMPGRAPVEFEYGAGGQLRTMRSATRSVSLTYDARQRLSTVLDSFDRSLRFEYDDADRLVRQSFFGNRTVEFSNDETGNLRSITPPGRPIHTFTYSSVDLPLQYAPPPVPGSGLNLTEYEYDRDRAFTVLTRPNGTTIDATYDVDGRLEAIGTAAGEYRYGYDTVTGLITSVTAPDGGRVTIGYDGTIPVHSVFEGAAEGSIAWEYDVDLAMSSEHVICPTTTSKACEPLTFAYDADKLLTGAGDVMIVRDRDNGRMTNVSVGNLVENWDYSDFGELNSRTTVWNSVPIHREELGRDRGGRIVTKRVAMDGDDTVYTYQYDVEGRLADVLTDGVLTAHYEYDLNGNRLSMTSGVQVKTASCDDQDRLITYATTTYQYSPNGYLSVKSYPEGVTEYTYDDLGNLIRVGLPDGRMIEYAIDANGGRAAKTIDGVTAYRLLYSDDLHPAASVDAEGNVTARFVYGSRMNVPDLVLKGNDTYRIVADHVGSPILVVNAATGEVVQRMKWDEYGVLLEDTNPGFQPFGFAGGLYDHDTGLVRFGARDYDPHTGRFVSKDPIGFDGGDTNLYAYTMNDPVNLIDPSGLLFDGAINAGEAYGEEALGTYADILTDPDAAWYEKTGAAVGGFFSALWTPCTSDSTFAVLSTAAGGAGGWRAAGSKVAGKEFSHWIPDRALKKSGSSWIRTTFGTSKFNGNYVYRPRHFMHDPYRYLKGTNKGMKTWSKFMQQADRMPRVYYGLAAGGGAGAAAHAGGSCGCS